MAKRANATEVEAIAQEAVIEMTDSLEREESIVMHIGLICPDLFAESESSRNNAAVGEYHGIGKSRRRDSNDDVAVACEIFDESAVVAGKPAQAGDEEKHGQAIIATDDGRVSLRMNLERLHRSSDVGTQLCLERLEPPRLPFVRQWRFGHFIGNSFCWIPDPGSDIAKPGCVRWVAARAVGPHNRSSAY